MSLSVVWVGYDNEADFKQSLSATRHSLKDTSIKDWIVVDDGSIDQTYQYIRTHFPDIRCIRHEDPIWPMKSTNQGVSLTDAEFCLIIRPGVRLQCDDISQALAHFDDPATAMVAGTISNDATSLSRQSSIWPVGIRGGLWQIPMRQTSVQSLNEGDCLVAASRDLCIVRTAYFHHVGGFDPIFLPGNLDDVDFGLQLMNQGWLVRYTQSLYGLWARPKQIVAEPTDRIMKKINRRNLYLLTWKSGLSFWQWVQHFLWLFFRLITFQIQHTQALILALWSLLTHPQSRSQRSARPLLQTDKIHPLVVSPSTIL